MAARAIVVRQIVSDRVFVSDPLVNPTAVIWLDESILVHAAGTLEQPQIYRVSIAGDRFRARQEIHGLPETGALGPLPIWR